MVFESLFSKQAPGSGSRDRAALLESPLLHPRASSQDDTWAVERSRRPNDDNASSSCDDKEAGSLDGLSNNRRARSGRRRVLTPDQRSTLVKSALGLVLALLLLLFVLNTSLWTKDAGCAAGPVVPARPSARQEGQPDAGGQEAAGEDDPFDGGRYETNSDEHGRYLECPGTSSAAARRAGCAFDVLLYGWLPRPCFDEATYAYHVKPGSHFDYGFYADAAGTWGIPMTELMEGDTERYPAAYVSHEQHWQHCSYLLNTSVRFRWREPAVVLDVHLHQQHMADCLEHITNPGASRSLEVDSDSPKADFTAKRRCYVQNM